MIEKKSKGKIYIELHNNDLSKRIKIHNFKDHHSRIVGTYSMYMFTGWPLNRTLKST